MHTYVHTYIQIDPGSEEFWNVEMNGLAIEIEEEKKLYKIEEAKLVHIHTFIMNCILYTHNTYIHLLKSFLIYH